MSSYGQTWWWIWEIFSLSSHLGIISCVNVICDAVEWPKRIAQNIENQTLNWSSRPHSLQKNSHRCVLIRFIQYLCFLDTKSRRENWESGNFISKNRKCDVKTAKKNRKKLRQLICERNIEMFVLLFLKSIPLRHCWDFLRQRKHSTVDTHRSWWHFSRFWNCLIHESVTGSKICHHVTNKLLEITNSCKNAMISSIIYSDDAGSYGSWVKLFSYSINAN